MIESSIGSLKVFEKEASLLNGLCPIEGVAAVQSKQVVHGNYQQVRSKSKLYLTKICNLVSVCMYV